MRSYSSRSLSFGRKPKRISVKRGRVHRKNLYSSRLLQRFGLRAIVRAAIRHQQFIDEFARAVLLAGIGIVGEVFRLCPRNRAQSSTFCDGALKQALGGRRCEQCEDIERTRALAEYR